MQKGLKTAEIIRPKHINQDLARELHRVWVVEGKLRVCIESHLLKRRYVF